MKNLEIKDLKVGDKIQRLQGMVWEILCIGNSAVFARAENGCEAVFNNWHLDDAKKLPEKHVSYMNIYKIHYASREEADKGAEVTQKYSTAKRIACLRLEFEEGQFDD